MKILEGGRLPKDLQTVVETIEAEGPAKASPVFQKKLREQLILKHKSLMMQTDKSPEKAPANSSSGGAAQKNRTRAPFFFGRPQFGAWAYAAGFAVIVIIASIVSYPMIPAPQVEGYSLKENVREISYNAPIKIVFTQPMDRGSVENAFHIEPRVEGEIRWEGNSMLFFPGESFRVGERYAVYVEKEAKSILQKQMDYGYEETFQIAGPPQVILFNPANGSEMIETGSKITIMFDRPMTALKSLDEGEASMPEIRISPSVKGRFKWLGTNSVQFIPEKLAYSTTYTVTVPKGVKAADGGSTDSDFTSSFTTVIPALVYTMPYEGYRYNGPDTLIRLDFNQPMDLAKAVEFIELYKYKGDNRNIREFVFMGFEALNNFKDEDWDKVNFTARHLTIEDLKKEVPSGVEFKEEDINKDALVNTIILEHPEKLAYGSQYLVAVRKGFPGAEGDKTFVEDSSFLFGTVGALQVTKTDPPADADLETYKDSEYGRTYRGRLTWTDITFSQPLEADQEFADFIEITPSKKDADGETVKPVVSGGYDDTSLSISFPFDPSTAYTITVKAGLKDQFGQKLEKDHVFGFKTAALLPDLDLAEDSDISVLDANTAPVYYLKHTNVDYADFNFKKLSREEFMSIYSGGYVSYDAYENVPGPFVSWKKKLENKFNQKGTAKIDLAAETGGALAPGFYYFEASNPEVIDSYYNSPVKERQVFVYTYSALTVKQSADELLVWAVSLKDGSPVSGMNISVLNREGKEVMSGVTDKDGLVSFKTSKKDLPADENGEYYDYYPDDYTVIGSKGDDLTLSHSTWSEGIAPWNFNIDYSMVQPEYYVYLYTDRPIYRPGHTVYYKGLVRKDTDARFQLPEGQKVHVVIEDSRGDTLLEQDHTLSASGAFSGEITLSDKGRTGNYTIVTSLPDLKAPSYLNTFYSSFMVAEYRKPDYELTIETDKDDYVNGETAKLKVKGAYFFGAPMPGAKIEWTVKGQDYYFFLPYDSDSPYASRWFSFSDDGYFCYWGCEGESAVVSSGKAVLDESGYYTIELPLDISEKKLSQLYTVEVTAYDLNNQTVSNRVTMPVHAGEYYVGIINDDYIVKMGGQAEFEVVTVDYKGMPVQGKSVEVSYNRRVWNTVKKKNVDGGFYYENSYDDELIEKKTVVTDDKGHAVVSFEAGEVGGFRAVAVSKDGKNNSVTASTSVYVSGGEFVNWGMENNDRIELVADKMEYKPGDTAKIMVKSPYQNVWALVTKERGGILEKDVVKIESNTDTIEVPLSEDSIPNIFVSVVLVKGSGNTAGLAEPPIGANDERAVAAFKAGYATLQVENSSRLLNIDVKTEWEKYKPGDEVTVMVKTTDASGKPVEADVSVSVVDKSVLSLTESVTADLLNAFYRRRMLGVNTAQTLTKAISRVNVMVEAGLKGGGGGAPEKRGTFKDTAHWEASLKTNADGNGKITFKLPDNLTTWEILAIGITDDTLVGSKKHEFIVSKDVMVRAVLPRFMIINDTMKIGAVVHNYLDKEETFTVKLAATGVELSEGAAEKTITLKPGTETKVEWPVKVLNQKEAVFTFDVRSANDPLVGDILEQKLPVEPFGFPEVTATSLTIDDGKKHVETVWLPNNIDTDFGELTLAVSPTLTGSLGTGLEYLMTFPYGCVEQTTSALLPNLVLEQLLDLPTVDDNLVDREKLKKFIESGLQTIYKYQNGNGGWGVWENSEPSAHLTAYVLYTLHQAQKAGYTVEESVIENGREYLRNYINMNPLSKVSATDDPSLRYRFRLDANERAYALYVLAESGLADLALTNHLYEFKSQLNLFSKAYLAMTLNTIREGEITDAALKTDINNKIDTLVREITAQGKETPRGIHFEEEENLYSMFDTNTRTTAIVLQMLSRVDSEHPYIPKILRHLLMEKNDGRFASTQETAVSLIAMIEYIVNSKELEAAYNGIVTVNGEEKLNKSFTTSNISERDVITIALKELQPDNRDNEITFTRNGSGKMYADMNLKYYLPAEEIEPRDEGLLVTQEYFAVGDRETANPLKQVKLGETLRGKITIVAPNDMYYVMVEDFLPAGLEGVDFSLKTSQMSLQDSLYEKRDYYDWWYFDSSWYFNHKEVRDDRMMYFADFLPAGVYELNYFVRATTPGEFRDKPALAQELYFPEVFGRSKGDIFKVTE